MVYKSWMISFQFMDTQTFPKGLNLMFPIGFLNNEKLENPTMYYWLQTVGKKKNLKTVASILFSFFGNPIQQNLSTPSTV